MKYLLYDAHAHLGSLEEQNIRKTYPIGTLMNASTPEECQKVKELALQAPHIIPTFGIHPWGAHQIQIETLLPYLKEGKIIGEIGMDSVWCEVPLQQQEKIFVQQLELAEEWRKPVILHTKGEEKRIVKLIQPYTIPILIHWYSDEKYLEEYIQKDCYFTIGPEFKTSLALQQVARLVPLERLFVETDGISAVEWALKREVKPQELPKLLEEAMQWVADLKGITLEEVAKQMQENWLAFINE